MSDMPTQPPGWYYAQGDPPGTQRYWDGTAWQGGPQPVPGGAADSATAASGSVASAGSRVGARIIDWIIWAVISLVSSAVIGGAATFDVLSGETPDRTARTIAGSLIGLALVSAYEILMVANQGGTLGKKVLNLKVVGEDGSPATMDESLKRFAPYAGLSALSTLAPVAIGGLISFIILIVGIAGLVMMFTDDRRQTPWDKIGKTLVVDSK